MRRGVIIGFVVLGLSACGQGQNGSSESSQGSPTGAEAAKPGVGAGANQDATSCLDLVASAKYGDAVPVCTRALSLDSANEKLKAALETANEKLAAGAADAAAGAQDAADEASEAAKGAAKTY